MRAPGRRSARARPVGRGLLAALLGLLLAGCVAIPTDGRVVAGGDVGQEGARAALRVTAEGPAEGADERQVVEGFLAAVAGLDDFSVAREFLAPDALDWRPGDQTVVHDDVAVFSPTVRTADDVASVQVQIDVVARIDEAGRYVEQAPTPEEVGFDLVQVRGEWRIADLPPGVLVSQVDAARVLTDFEVYFLDPTLRYLVPDVRWFPRLTSSATSLVRALLGGPSTPYLGALVSAAPAGTRLDLPTVQVVDGVATVDLTDEVLDADREERALLRAQLLQTLRAVPGVAEVVVSVDGSPLDQLTGQDAPDAPQLLVDPVVDDRPFVLGAPPADAVAPGSQGEVEGETGDGTEGEAEVEGETPALGDAGPVDGGASVPVLGADGRPLAAPGSSVLRLDRLDPVPVEGTDPLAAEVATGLAVSQDASVLAGLDASRRTLWLQTQAGAAPLPLVSGRGELLAPSFDPPGLPWVWTVSAGTAGSGEVPTVLAATAGDGAAPATELVEARFLVPGDEVRAVRVSRDGARVLLVVSHGDGSVDVEVRGVRRDAAGRPLSLSEAAFTVAAPLSDAVDAGWVTDEQVVVLGREGEEAVGPVVSQVGGTTEALAPTPGAVSVSAGSSARSIVVGTADGTVLRRSGALWLDGPAGVSPVYPG
ncbi:LpqB family beta-propeller domain-containing protein [Aquipuribacter hungaricus]|uniref:LpqB family beta-propeller domain-containing protein n=1 Tax=Aquipuribacter hungaricus TaxID=545624 RepID=A0ABV7WDA9_9MICO